MRIKEATAALTLAGLIATCVPSAAMTGIGCPDLPEYYRAVGTVQNGEGSCGMTMAEARRILARGNPDQPDAVAQPDAPTPRAHHKRHHRHRTPHS